MHKEVYRYTKSEILVIIFTYAQHTLMVKVFRPADASRLL